MPDVQVEPSAKFADAVAEFRKTGLVILRGALPPDWVGRYRDLAAAWFEQLDQRVARGERNYLLDFYAKQSGISLGLTTEVLSAPPTGIRSFLSALYKGGAWRAGFLDEELGALIDACSIRRQKPAASERALRYHQDSAVVGGVDGVVFWLPLDPIDRDTPGLEVVPYWQRPLQHAFNPVNSYLESTEPVTQAGYSVEMARGDVLVFSLATPHRTLLTPGMTKTRFSIDLRAMPLSKVPPNYPGYVIVPRG